MNRYRVLYVEQGAFDYPATQRIIGGAQGAPVITINNYGEVFNRSRQDFQSQKRWPALIIGVSRGPFLHEAGERISSSAERAYYSDQLRNCLFNCDYCFLQGMHRSAHTLLFVNSADYHAAARAVSSDAPILLNVSFLSDMVAFERTLPLLSEWSACAVECPNLTVEVRTKGGSLPSARKLPVVPNMVFTWTLSPEKIIRRHERGTASLGNRLRAIGKATEAGRRVQIAIDPILLVEKWKEHYEGLIRTAFEQLNPASIEAVSYGVFRMSTDYLDRIRRDRADTELLHHPFRRSDGLATYSPDEVASAREFVGQLLHRYMGSRKVRFVHG
jgi:spore photoproduct lyase